MKKTVLYIEDNDDNIYLLKTFLEKRDYHVLITSDGIEGINVAKEKKPNLILVDVGLPIMDGYQVTSILKGDPDTKNIPVIIFTAHAMVDDEIRAHEVGADGFVVKPVDTKDLLLKIEQLLK